MADNDDPGLENNVELSNHYRKLGSEAYQQGDIEASIANWRKAILRNPTNAVLHYNVGIGLYKAGQHESAIAEWHEAIRLKPDFLEAHQWLCNSAFYQARTTNSRNDWETTKALCRNVLEIAPDNADYLRWLAYSESKCKDKSPPENDSELSDNCWKLGSEAYQQGDFEASVNNWRKAVLLDPASADLHYNLGLGLYKIGQQESAIAEWREAIRLKSDFLEAHQWLCRIAIDRAEKTSSRGAWKSVISSCRNVLELEPEKASYLRWLGFAELKCKDMRAAMKTLEAAIEADPLNQWSYLALARIQKRLGHWRGMWRTIKRMTAQPTFDPATCRPNPVCIFISIALLAAAITGGVLLVKKVRRKD